VEALSPRYAQLLAGHSIQGRPLADVSDLFWKAGELIVRLVQEAYQQDKVQTTPRIVTRGDETRELYFVYTIVPSHEDNGHASGVVIYALDETEQRAQQVIEEREQLRLIFDNTPAIAMALFDAASAELIMGTPRYLEIVERVLKRETRDLLGHRWHELTPDSSREEAERTWNSVLVERRPVRQSESNWPIAVEDQNLVWDWNMIPILDQEQPDRVRYVLVSAIEITEQVRARQEMEELNRLKDEFLALLSHELRNPLTSISGNAQILRRQIEHQGDHKGRERASSDQEIQLLDRILEQTRQMNRLIEEITDVTRVRSNVLKIRTKQGVDAVALAQRVVATQSAISDRTLELQASEQRIAGAFDEDRLAQVLTNLISNAIRYSSPETAITVGVERRMGEGQRPEVLFWVRDQGPGISEEEQAHIFERFYQGNQRASEGLGLGLYIASEIVRQQGGRLWLESTIGEGSTFSVTLPLNGKEESQR
jgi:signal transduction histidine kinase